ncbi:hypothetical protein H5V45_01445 [Nocardioides sp. KIGAM211]|uniref:Uncharacterized protein n=1 Tax=Nocardioides luti TaxID=2761101 RepID=A0A7X0RF86_9ACTN|nr:hypothetical protein [Nocardioides luti]MBB6625973.1 hypothetical protein [Nocardioides luti]
MILGLTLVVLVATLAFCAGSTRPASEAREVQRRERYLRDHADRINTLDVERHLADQLPPALLADVMAGAAALGLPATTMWRWVERHDAELLALCVRAGMGQGALERHLAEGTVPDRRSLTLFADLNSGPAPVDVVAPAPVVPISAQPLTRRELGRFDGLPPISEPGFWPYDGGLRAS